MISMKNLKNKYYGQLLIMTEIELIYYFLLNGKIVLWLS